MRKNTILQNTKRLQNNQYLPRIQILSKTSPDADFKEVESNNTHVFEKMVDLFTYINEKGKEYN